VRYTDLEHIEIPGVVVDVKDEFKRGRVRVKVLNVYDNLETNDIPWASPAKSANGTEFRLPKLGQVVTVNFVNGDLYMPEYTMAEHYNVNLQKKLEDLSDDEYADFTALHFTDKTQIYDHSKDGLFLDHKMQQINVVENGINLNLKDNQSNLNLGTEDADQAVMLGTHYIEWFDKLVRSLRGENGGPFFGNLGSPVIPAPDLIQILIEYDAIKQLKFLSQHVSVVDNNMVNAIKRPAIDQIGDKWKHTKEENNISQTKPTTFKTIPGIKDDSPNENFIPPNDNQEPPAPKPTPQEKNAPTEEGNSELSKIIKAMQTAGYIIYDRPYELNIVGVRKWYNGDKVPNTYDDDMNVFYKDDQNIWIHKRTKISTIPGKYYFDKPNNPKGTGILMPAQYKNSFTLGTYSTHGYALRPILKQHAFRDNNKNGFINLEQTTMDVGNHAMLIHAGAMPGAKSTYVNNWSAGCQVFKNSASHKIFFDMCLKHKDLYGNKFTYTLMTQRQIDGDINV
jgi:phage baseplate assembly protein gpV